MKEYAKKSALKPTIDEQKRIDLQKLIEKIKYKPSFR
jgi:hypothetical protein